MELATFGAFSLVVAALATRERKLVTEGRFERAKPFRIFVASFVIGTLGYLIFGLSRSIGHVFFS